MPYDSALSVSGDSYGPRTEFGQLIHATKYRAPEERFDDYCVRYARAVSDDDRQFRRTLRYLREQMILPAGRQQHTVGRPYLTTAMNCYVGDDIPDTFEGIMDALKNGGLTLRTGGGDGWNFSSLRPEGDPIRGLGHGSFASGPLSFMDLWNGMCATILTAGHRRGAMMGVLDVDHPDILKFVHAKRNSGRLTNFNISVAVTDRFMEALDSDGLYDLQFNGTVYSQARAVDVWAMMMESNWDWAEPGVLFMDRINQRNPLYYCETIRSTNPSMPAGTRVNTKDGIFPIESLDNKTFYVKSLDGQWASASCFLSSDNAKLLEINFGGGRTVRCTKEHKWPVLLNGRYVRVSTVDLRPGDNIPANRNEFMNHDCRPDLTYKDGLVAGIAFGDGSYNIRSDDGRAYLHFHCNRDDIELQDIVATYFGANVALQPDEAVVHVSTDRIVCEFVDKVGLTFGEKKRLPATVWQSNNEFVGGFIDGLFSTDGYVGATPVNNVILTNKDQNVIKEVGILLAFHGIIGTMTSGETKLNGKIYERWDIKLSSNATKRFANLFSLSCKRKAVRLSALTKTETRHHVNADHLTVRSVTSTGECEPVWDIRVDYAQHVFPTEWSYTGNCGELPLPPHGACLLGSINIVKFLTPSHIGRDPALHKYNEYAVTHLPPALRIVDPNSSMFTVDYELMDDAVDCLVRACDAVIDITHYPLPQQRLEELSKRRMGIGVTGMANAIEIMGLAYGSDGYLSLQDRILERITKQTYRTSIELAKEKGPFPLFDGERYMEGWFVKNRLDDELRWGIENYGLRNSHLGSIAPTGTISMAADNVSSGIEPPYSLRTTMNIFMPDGPQEFTVDDYAMRFFGVAGKTANETSAQDHVRVLCGAQHWTDQAVSKTCNVTGQVAGNGQGVTFTEFKDLYLQAYHGGAKGCTTFNRNGKRAGVRHDEATPEIETGTACQYDPETGLRSCDG